MNKIITFFRESQTARFLIPVGIMLIIFGAIMLNINSKNQNYIKTEATVTKTELAEEAYTDIDGNRVEATYKVYIKYTVEGKEYNVELGELSGYKVGQKTTIYYNPEDPTQITQIKSLILPLVIIIAGIIAFISGIISGIKAIKKYKNMKTEEKGWSNE